MTIQVRFVKQTDHLIWNEYVKAHPNATPYHHFGWLQSVEQAYQHKNIGAIAFENGRVVGVLPSIEMRRPLLRPFICALPYCDLGFVLANDSAIVDKLLAFMREHLAHINGQSLALRDYINEPASNTQMEGQKVRMLLPLPSSSDELLSGFKSKLRSQIRKSEKNGLRYEIHRNGSGLNDFYHIFAINMRKLGSPVHSKKWFERIFENYKENSILSVVYSENVPVGAGITLSSGGVTCIPWASTVAEYNRLAPNMMLYWSLLKEACDNNMQCFDFGRSTFNEGTYRFKAQWGAAPQLLNWYDAASESRQDFTNQENDECENAPQGKIRPMVEKVWAKLPLNVTTTLGPKIRKHISL
ncbi:MAG: GNAT family N-acetyltransferase [Paraglaciecola chathamensis]